MDLRKTIGLTVKTLLPTLPILLKTGSENERKTLVRSLPKGALGLARRLWALLCPKAEKPRSALLYAARTMAEAPGALEASVAFRLEVSMLIRGDPGLRTEIERCFDQSTRVPLSVSAPFLIGHKIQSEKGAQRKYALLSPRIPEEVKPAGVVYPVWFGTNRKPAGDTSFSNRRGVKTYLGKASVFVPKAHCFGEIGGGLFHRLLRFGKANDRICVQKLEARERDVFFSEIREQVQSTADAGHESQALIFLHGFNVSFNEAAIRAAQIGYDLRVTGATAFFSWPCRGNASAYSADEATIEASELAITDFLIDFTQNCGAEKVHLIAHSMGNRGLLRALQRISADTQAKGTVKFGQIFLAAPDIDRDLFLNLASLYREYSERTTLYTSSGDKAVHLSAILHAAPRAGYFPPHTVVHGVDTVAVPNFDIDRLGHGYFAQASALLHDIYDLMRHGEPPNRRQRLTLALDSGGNFWEMNR